MMASQPVLFVHYTHPDDAKDVQIQTEVRRHVMENYSRVHRPKCNETFQMELLPQPLLQRADPARRLRSAAPAGLAVDNAGLELIRFVWAEATYRYRPFRGFWSELAVQDPTVMALTLANASIWRRQTTGALLTGVEFQDYPESARYYSRSLKSLSGVLAGRPRAAEIGVGVVGSVLGLACHDITAENWERWAHHLNGLVVVTRLRGGLDDLSPDIAAFAAWTDVAGNAIFNRRPQLALPIADTPSQQAGTTPAVRRLLPELGSDLAQAMEKLASVAATVNDRGNDPSFWTDDMAAIRLLVPAIHALQSVPAKGAMEMVRLASLMLLSTLKDKFRLSAADLIPLRRSFVAGIAMQPPSRSWRWEIWALVTAALQVEAEADRAPILEALRETDDQRQDSECRGCCGACQKYDLGGLPRVTRGREIAGDLQSYLMA